MTTILNSKGIIAMSKIDEVEQIMVVDLALHD
jgi:hypothetical protein